MLQKWGCRNSASLCSNILTCRISECLGFSCILCENCLILHQWGCRNSASLCLTGLRCRISECLRFSCILYQNQIILQKWGLPLKCNLFRCRFYSVNVRNLSRPNHPLVECCQIHTVLKVAYFFIRYLLVVSNSGF